MNPLPPVTPAMAVGWRDLVAELNGWRAAGQVATLWWRDDDAVMPNAKLDRLFSIGGNVPIALAVIPAAVETELADWISRSARSFLRSNVAILQHGWRHSNHSVGGKKSEFPPDRPRENVVSDIAAGRARLAQLFGMRALPVLVPPWNRFDDCFLPLLGSCGIKAVSRMNPRRAAAPVLGVIEVNVHVDVVAWKGDRGFIGEEGALGCLIGHLRSRRLGHVCRDEPTGILTHHTVLDAATDAFLHRLVEVIGAHPAARWLDATEFFA
jgi:hypothetical protein